MGLKFGVFGKDVITGFSGYVIGRTEYITGCAQLLLQPVGKDGKRPEAEWIDEQRVVAATSSKNRPISLDNSVTPGFDKAAPKR